MKLRKTKKHMDITTITVSIRKMGMDDVTGHKCLKDGSRLIH